MRFRRDVSAEDAPDFAVSEPSEATSLRSPVTAIRLAGALLLLAALYAALLGAENASFATNFGELLASAPHWLVSAAVGVCQIGFMVPTILGFASQVVLRRFARIGRMLLAAVICVGGLWVMSRLVGGSILPLLPGRHQRLVAAAATGRRHLGYGISAAFPTTVDLGVIAAWLFTDRGRWSLRWRRVGWMVLGLGVVAHLGVSLADPVAIITIVTMAAAASLTVQLALGAPNTRPRAATVGRLLEQLGHRPVAVERLGRFRGYAGFRVRLDDDRRLFVKIISRDAWAALFPVRLYRAARYRDVGQDRPLRSLRSIVEHEALCALKAHADGVPTARLVAVAEFPPDAMMMAFEARSFQALRDLDASRRTPELLTKVWSIVEVLQRTHTVHRRFNADAVLVAEDDSVALVEFASASLGVVDSALSTDVAEVLAATAAAVGPSWAVRAAIDGVGAAAVTAALPRLQPLALTPPTRAAIKAAGGLDAVRAEIQRVTGVQPPPIAELERIKTRTLATVAMSALALWTLIPQLLGVGTIWEQLQRANWSWAVAAVGLSAITYVGAAVALDGSLPERLPLGPNIGVQMATSFVGVAAPGGGLALLARFLQKRGVDAAAAVAAVGVNRVAGFIVHVTLIGLFVGFAGSSGLESFQLPSLGFLGLIAAAIIVLGAVGAAVPWSRRLLLTRVLPATRRSISGVGEIAHQPATMIELFGGSLAITMGNILALEVAVSAFGPGPAFTSVALVYLVGAVVFALAPTPGGIGAVEATLIAGLTSAGMAGATAAAAVILFRLATFWLPLLPGWAAWWALQRSGNV